MQVLWLRYLTEIDENTREVPEELLANPEVKKAVTALEEQRLIATNLKKQGIAVEVISQCTGLSVEEVTDL